MEKNNKNGINKAAGNTTEKERPQRNTWFDKQYQIIFEDKNTAYTTMINGNISQNTLDYKDKRKLPCVLAGTCVLRCLYFSTLYPLLYFISFIQAAYQ